MTKERIRSRGVIGIDSQSFEVRCFSTCMEAALHIMAKGRAAGIPQTISTNIKRTSYRKGSAYGYTFINIKCNTPDKEIQSLLRMLQHSHIVDVLLKRFYKEPITDERTLEGLEAFAMNFAEFTESGYEAGHITDSGS